MFQSISAGRTRCVLVCILLLVLAGTSFGQEAKPKRYALLIAVTKYQHTAMNRPALRYPEADAKAIGKFLEQHGYQVDYLLGSVSGSVVDENHVYCASSFSVE